MWLAVSVVIAAIFFLTAIFFIFDVILFFVETYNIHITEYYDNGKWYWCYNTLNVEGSEYYVNSDNGYDTIIEALDKGIFEVAKHCIA